MILLRTYVASVYPFQLQLVGVDHIELHTNIEFLSDIHDFPGPLSGLRWLKQSSSERSHLKDAVVCTL